MARRKSVGASVDYVRKVHNGDHYVSVWCRGSNVSLTPREARRLAVKILQAADRCEHQESCERIKARRVETALGVARAALMEARAP